MKKIISSVLILLVLLLIFIYWYNYSGGMVSKGPDDIKNITVTVFPCKEEKKEIRTVDDKDEIEKIYNMLDNTAKIRNNRYPSHAESAQWDPEFEIDILYKNGEQEHIFSAPETGFICKYLNSTGGSGDKGFRKGENQSVWDYIFAEEETPDAEVPEPKKDEEVVAPTPVKEEKPDREITEIPLDSVKGITPEEAEKLCYNALGEKDEETGFIFSFGTAGAVETGGTQYYVIRASWLVNNSHLSYIGDFFVSADGRTIYSGTALAGEYTMDKIIWEK